MKRALVLALLLFVACAGELCGESYLAELAAHHGDVQRDTAGSVGAWARANKGDRFQVGDGLRTGASATAELSLSSDGVALVEANTLLRFLDRDPREGDNRLALEQGVVSIESGGVELDVHTPRALARVAENSKVRIVAEQRDIHFDVLVGRVSIADDAGVRDVKAGEQATLTAAAPERVAERAAEPVPTPEPASARSEQGRRTDLTLGTLESVTIHAPELPLSVRIPAPRCERVFTLSLAGRPIPLTDPAGFVAPLHAGSHAYRMRCGSRVISQGTLRVLRDVANMELPKTAPRLDVEADGRRYTVRYQNVLPIVEVQWRAARPAQSYVLHLRRDGRERTFRSTRPNYTLPGAELREGDHEYWFTSASGQRSEVSRLRIEFDNTARSLSLSEPAEGSSGQGDATHVSGVALLRSQVSANGVPLALDPKGRFRGQVPLGADRSVLVRAVHPAAGVHYYLRRLR